MADCPCGSRLPAADCCAPIISGGRPAATALALMRSRYTAYVTRDIDWIVKSCVGGEEGVDRDATLRWARDSEWLGLEILGTEQGGAGDETGKVEFVATYVLGGLRDRHHERATFVRKDGLWLYDEGEVIPETVKRAVPKVGRNEACPCGSGKKYKACHGR